MWAHVQWAQMFTWSPPPMSFTNSPRAVSSPVHGSHRDVGEVGENDRQSDQQSGMCLRMCVFACFWCAFCVGFFRFNFDAGGANHPLGVLHLLLL